MRTSLTFKVYSGPRGVFKSHVDTPRSETQFASLVVCLPSAHKGGILVLRHNNCSIEFDWSSSAPKNIQWAAFYSDCEHEVMPLVSGHRVTLTYNLYYQATQPQPSQSLPLLMHSCPVYHDLQAALQAPGFMKHGSILGFYCNHAYPHSNIKLRGDLSMAMKGVDQLIYAVCRSLGLETQVRPILESEDEEEDYEEYDSSDEDCWEEDPALDVHRKARKRLHDFHDHGFHIPRYTTKHMDSSASHARPTDEDLDTILPEYRNMTDDPEKHPLAQHELTLKYRKLYRELRIQQNSYAPTDPDAKLEYLKSKIEVEGLAPPYPYIARVGSEFHEIKTPYEQIENPWVRCSSPLLTFVVYQNMILADILFSCLEFQEGLAQRSNLWHSLGNRAEA
jgi:hypothetical protein